MNSASASTVVRVFDDDLTIRWSCRIGEYIAWVSTDSFLSSDRASAWTIRDFWQTGDGDFVSITNRWPDLPEWFELHPSEVSGNAVSEMIKRLKTGAQPDEPMNGSNIWRVKAGDRLVWVTTSSQRHPVREILDFRACALVIGENSMLSADSIIEFGVPRDSEPSPKDAVAVRAGFDAAVAAGIPREFATEWSFGG